LPQGQRQLPLSQGLIDQGGRRIAQQISPPDLVLAHGMAECLADDSADQLLLRADAALCACADPAAIEGQGSPA
jgi:hypothetical protein